MRTATLTCPLGCSLSPVSREQDWDANAESAVGLCSNFAFFLYVPYRERYRSPVYSASRTIHTVTSSALLLLPIHSISAFPLLKRCIYSFQSSAAPGHLNLSIIHWRYHNRWQLSSLLSSFTSFCPSLLGWNDVKIPIAPLPPESPGGLWATTEFFKVYCTKPWRFQHAQPPFFWFTELHSRPLPCTSSPTCCLYSSFAASL